MFKQILSAVLAAGALLPVFWFNAAPNGAEFCTEAPNSTPVEYSVTRENSLHAGEFDTLTYTAPSAFCTMVEDFPAPVES